VKLSLYLAGKVLFCPGIATSFPRSGTGKAMEKSNIFVEENPGPNFHYL
jgi:hypothetical protein